ncbi:MAG: histidine--tRNA ligase [Acidobacteriota bacterium]
MKQIKAAKGTRDILPDEMAAWHRLEEASRRVFALYGFGEIRTPIFEPTELFRKSTGAHSDIVTKQMYTFSDRAGRSLTLRPEGTPGVVRAVLEDGLLRPGDIQRLYYIVPMFRYERPQKGRYRQFSQIGVEAIGSSDPAIDAEVIQMATVLFRTLGIADTRLVLNSVGHDGCRVAYRTALREKLAAHREELCRDCQRRLDENPLRILDCKVPSCQQYKAMAPSILEYLCGDCDRHFAEVQRMLKELDVDFVIDDRLVRGLDYYTRTAFEITSDRLGAQNALCGGGRYDDLVGWMGGPDTPAFGFAMGADRMVVDVLALLRREEGGGGIPIDVYIVHLGREALGRSMAAAVSLRARGIATRLDPQERDLKKQLARASALDARFALIIGEREIAQGSYRLKRMADGHQSDIPAGDWDVMAGEINDG